VFKSAPVQQYQAACTVYLWFYFGVVSLLRVLMLVNLQLQGRTQHFYRAHSSTATNDVSLCTERILAKMPTVETAVTNCRWNEPGTDSQKEISPMTTTPVPTFHLKAKRFAKQFQYSIISLVLMYAGPSRALAQDNQAHTMAHESQEATAEQQSRQSALIRIVREATERFHDVRAAENEGYRLEFGCVSGDDFGAMGLHYVNDGLVGHGVVDATRPQIILYEAQPNGRLKLTGADYLLLADAWDASHPGVPPQLMGQIFHYFASPNRFGLPAFYTLHVWAWKENPKGAFVNWHPNVSCQSFVGTTTR
jgi:hypothetical protein